MLTKTELNIVWTENVRRRVVEVEENRGFEGTRKLLLAADWRFNYFYITNGLIQKHEGINHSHGNLKHCVTPRAPVRSIAQYSYCHSEMPGGFSKCLHSTRTNV